MIQKIVVENLSCINLVALYAIQISRLTILVTECYVATREDLYKLVMRIINSATVLEDRLRDGKITTGADASASFASQEMHKQVMFVCLFVSSRNS